MKTSMKILFGGAAITSALVGLALATPIVDLTSPLLSVGNQNNDIHERGTFQLSNGDEFKAVVETKGPATISVQEAAYSLGGHNGWHSHPGVVAVTLISGTIQWYNENCEPTVYTAGDSWVEGSQHHYFRNIGTGTAELTAVFITAQGQALRIDQAAPPCAAALGLD
jgi:quercetin dioxygenase-like cupin family protein